MLSRILIPKTQMCHLRPKSCLRTVKSRNQIALIWLVSAYDKMFKSLEPLSPYYDISAQLYFLLIIT